MKKTITLFLFLSGISLGYAQKVPDKKLLIETSGKEYEYLMLEIDGKNGINEFQATKRTDGIWQFMIPDSVYEFHRWMRLSGINHSLVYRFHLTKEDSTSFGNYSFIPNEIRELNYISTDSITLPVLKNGMVTEENRRMDCYRFDSQDKEFEAYTAFIKSPVEAETIKPYGDTHAAVSRVYLSLQRMDKDKLSAVFDCLSDRQKQSLLGKEIGQFLTMKFPIIQLPSVQNSGLRPVVDSSNQFTLVIFSASWCVPCRKEIPLLKEIYRDLHPQGLDMVYISMDEAETKNDWIQLMKEESIPWNSFIAATQLDKIKKLFPHITYPTSFLVLPDGTFSQIEIRDKEKRKKLYSIVANPSTIQQSGADSTHRINF